MTSKEVLNKICYKCECNIGKQNQACPYRSISNDYCDEYESIKKDLEVLEILKKKLLICKCSAGEFIKMTMLDNWSDCKLTHNTIENFNKVKVWLSEVKE